VSAPSLVLVVIEIAMAELHAHGYLGGHHADASRPHLPNILLIVLDTTRADALGLGAGGGVAPSMKAAALHGRAYLRATSPSPLDTAGACLDAHRARPWRAWRLGAEPARRPGLALSRLRARGSPRALAASRAGRPGPPDAGHFRQRLDRRSPRLRSRLRPLRERQSQPPPAGPSGQEPSGSPACCPSRSPTACAAGGSPRTCAAGDRTGARPAT
jgi:hypothetical protein